MLHLAPVEICVAMIADDGATLDAGELGDAIESGLGFLDTDVADTEKAGAIADLTVCDETLAREMVDVRTAPLAFRDNLDWLPGRVDLCLYVKAQEMSPFE